MVIDDCGEVETKCITLEEYCESCIGVWAENFCLEGGIFQSNKGKFAFRSIIGIAPFSSILELEWYDETGVLLNSGKVTLKHRDTGSGYYDPYCIYRYQGNPDDEIFEVDQVLYGVTEIEIEEPGTYRLMARNELGCEYEAYATFTGQEQNFYTAIRTWQIGNEENYRPPMIQGLDLPVNPVYGLKQCETCGGTQNQAFLSDDCDGTNYDKFEYTPEDTANPCRLGGTITSPATGLSFNAIENDIASYVTDGVKCGCLFPPGTFEITAGNRKYGLDYVYVEWECPSPPSPPEPLECGDGCSTCRLEPVADDCGYILVCEDGGPDSEYEIDRISDRKKYKRIVYGPDNVAQYCEVITACSWSPCLFSSADIERIATEECCRGSFPGGPDPGIYFDLPFLPCDGTGYCPPSFVGDYPTSVNSLSIPEVSEETEDRRFATRIAPNPFNDELTISINTMRAGKFQVSLVDVLGNTLVQQVQNLDEGVNDRTWLLGTDFPAGMYLLIIEGESGERQVHKLIRSGQ